MALEQFRTTVSAVFWTETPDDSEIIVDGIKDAIPEIDRGSTLVTVEYVSSGRPVMTVPEPPPS
jgi:hypothetical protein